MKQSFLLLLLFTITSTFAQQAYYDDIDLTLTDIALKDELSSKIINTHSNSLSYSQVWNALKIVDLESASKVFLIYGFDDTDNNVTTDRTRNKNSNGGDVGEWNREHTYPKALGVPNLGTDGPGADAHMLRASDVQRNGSRGSKKFADGSGNSGTVNSFYWYPGDEWKGDIARMMMYMYLRYGNQCLPDNVGIGNPVANDAHMIDLFLQWNVEDPVSSMEEVRNDYLGNTSNTYAQGNRNPFIDNPYLATLIWGGPDAEDTWDIFVANEDFSIEESIQTFPNPVHDKLSIKTSNDLQINKIEFYNINGQLIKVENKITSQDVRLEYLLEGFYFLHISTNKGVVVKKLVVR